MRPLFYSILLLSGLALLLALSGVEAEKAGANATEQSDIRFFAHKILVDREDLSETVFRFSVRDMGEAPGNLTFKVEWARTSYGDAANEAINDLNRTATTNGSANQTGRSGSMSSNDTDRQNVEKKYELAWKELQVIVARNKTTEFHGFKYAPEAPVQPGYYIFRIQVIDENETKVVRWIYSYHPLLVIMGQIEEKIELNIITRPDFVNRTLFFKVSYTGPFLENPIALITANHLGLADHRVNISGLMDGSGGLLYGNLTFPSQFPIPQGLYTITLKGVDGANQTISVSSHFTIKTLALASDKVNEITSETGKLQLAIDMLADVTDGRISIEELNVNPQYAPNLTKLMTKHNEHLNPGGLRAMGRYLSVEPGEEVRSRLKNATMRFYVDRTDLDGEGRQLGDGIHGLRVFYFNETSGEWELVVDSGYDSTRGLVWARVSHFSVYGIFGTNVAPTATADPSSMIVEVGESFTLQGNGADLDGEIVEWAWDLDGDGVYEHISTTSGAITHSYPQTGTHIAKLRVSDEQGATGFDQITITVKEEDGDSGLPLPLWVTLFALLLAMCVTMMVRRS